MDQTLILLQLKKAACWLGSLSLAYLLSTSFAFAKCEEVVISGHPSYPPYQWRHDDEIVGASIDIARKILEEENIPVRTPYVGPWKRVLRAAEAGKIDMVVALKKTEERQKYLAFNESPFYINPFVVWVRKDKKFKFRDWDDLIDKQGGKNLGDRYGDDFDQFLNNNLTITAANSVEANFKLLANGRHDYYIHGLYPGLAYLTIHPFNEEMIPLEKTINDGFVHNAFSQKSDCKYLNELFNSRLQEMMDTGETKKAIRRNLLLWKEHGLQDKKVSLY